MLTLAGVLVGVAVALLAIWKLRVYPPIAAGYRAKVVCTALFGSGRRFDRQLVTQISADAYWIMRPFTIRVDEGSRTVTASLSGGLLARTAIHRDGLGATLVSKARARGAVASTANASSSAGLVGQATMMPSGPLLRVAGGREWAVAASRPALQKVVDAAFEEPNRRRLRRTYAVVVVQDGQIVAERYVPGITADMPLPGWSVAKSVINALVGILVHEGRLSLDERELMPHWRSPDPRAAITLEDLLRMRSGLRFSEVYANPWSDVLHMLYDCDDMVAYASSLPLVAPPGSIWSYSSGTTNILSAIIRRVVGDAAYHAWPREVLFDPLGMTSAVMEVDAAGTFVGSSYMLATARDWARFGQLFADEGRWNGGTILPASWVRFSTTPTTESPDGRFGAHWWLKLNPEIGGDTAAARRIASDAFFAVGHEGQTITVIPSRRLVIVRLGASIYIDAWNQAQFVADIQHVCDN